MVKKIVIENLYKNTTYWILGVLIYDKNDQLIPRGSVIGATTETLCELDNMTIRSNLPVYATGVGNYSLHNLMTVDRNLNYGYYTLGQQDSSTPVTIEVEFTTPQKINKINYITYNVDYNSHHNGGSSILKAYSESGTLIKEYTLSPDAQTKDGVDLLTPELGNINLHLIKSNNTIYTISNETLTKTNLTQPLTKSDYETHGIEDLNNITQPLTKQGLYMSEVGTLGVGKMHTTTINTTDFENINRIEVK